MEGGGGGGIFGGNHWEFPLRTRVAILGGVYNGEGQSGVC